MSGVLFEEDWTKSRVKGSNTLVSQNLSKSTNQAISESRRRDEADASGLEGTECYRSKELGAASRNRINCRAVLTGFFKAKEIDRLLLEELVAAKLEGALHEISGKGRAKAGCESASTFVLDNLTESANHAAIVSRGVELDPGLDSTWCY